MQALLSEDKKQAIREATGYSPDEIEFGNYKEPLTRFKGGYGYEGVLLYDKAQDKVQCHFCGNFYEVINIGHIRKCAKLNSAREYKLATGLAFSTALMGETLRRGCIERTRALGFSRTWTKEQKEAAIQKLTAFNRNRTGKQLKLESKNKRGTCPDQLLEKIKDLQKELGRVPTKKDFRIKHKGRFLGIIYETFGSWVTAVELAGLTPVSKDPDSKAHGLYRGYSKQELLSYIKPFYKVHKRTPSYSDFSRGLMPSHKTYRNYWNSLNDLRKETGVPIIVRVGQSKWAETMDYSLDNPKTKSKQLKFN